MAGKRGQVTIFIIIAILIVLAGLFIFLIYPHFGSSGSSVNKNPQAFIQSCVEDDLQNVVEKISLQGGSVDPSFFVYYDSNKLQYLCYTEKDNEPCVKQVSFLEDHVEKEIASAIKNSVDSCFRTLEEVYAGEGFKANVRTEDGEIEVNLVEGHVVLNLKRYLVTLTNDEGTYNYRSFEISQGSNLKKLIELSFAIVEDEATKPEGVDLDFYRSNNKDFELWEFKPYADGTQIYVIKNKKTGEVFQFASRSYVIPPGF